MSRSYPERALHAQVAQFLRIALPDDAVWTTFPAGGGGRVRGAQLKQSGLMAGWPDIQILVPSAALTPGGGVYGWAFICLELKSKRGALSPEQKDCHDRIRRAGGTVAVVRSIEDCERVLRSHCVPLRARAA